MSIWMLPEKREHQIAMETEAGREGLAVWRRVVTSMSGPQKVAKAFELTEMTRQIRLQGIRRQHPEARDSEVHEMYVDRLLQYHGTSLVEVRQKQQEQLAARSNHGEASCASIHSLTRSSSRGRGMEPASRTRS